jgi:hypothetical protein
MEDEKMENWKQFNGTELGGLMNKIYGNEGKPQINYPRLKTKPRENVDPFLPCGGNPGAVDPRKATRKKVEVEVPKLGRSEKSSRSAVQSIPRRRQESVIKAELDEISMRAAHYRPAHTRAISTDAEKDKYSQICAFKGGKGLPEELLQPIGEAPFELEAKRKEADRLSKLRIKYRGPDAVPVQSRQLSHREVMATQLTQEINERCDYLDSMKAIGASVAETAVVRAEIAQRVAELKRMDQE